MNSEERIEARERAAERAAEASWESPSEERLMIFYDPFMPREKGVRTAALVADAMIDERVPGMIRDALSSDATIAGAIDEALRSPSIVAAAILRLEPEHRDQIRVLLDRLADVGM